MLNLLELNLASWLPVVLNCTYNDANNTYIDNVTLFKARAHKNGQLELECATPIEARSPGQITEVY